MKKNIRDLIFVQWILLSCTLEKLLFKAIKNIIMIYFYQDGNKFIIFWLLDIESSSSQLKQQKIIDFISI